MRGIGISRLCKDADRFRARDRRPISDLYVPLRHTDLRASRTAPERPPCAAWDSTGAPAVGSAGVSPRGLFPWSYLNSHLVFSSDALRGRGLARRISRQS